MSQREHVIQDEYTEKKRYKVLFVFFIILSFFGVYAALGLFIDEYNILEKIEKKAIYVSHKSFAIGAFWNIPFLLMITYLMYLRLVNKLTVIAQTLFMKTAMLGFVAWVFTCTIYGFWFDSHMKINGYTYCYWYDSATRGSPTIWVQSERFCQKRASNMTIELFDYYDELNLQNKKPTDEALDIAITNIVKNKQYNKRKD